MLLSLMAAAILALGFTTGCRSAYYATLEKFGVYKRDLLKKRVTEARDDQKAAGQQFKDALAKLQSIYRFNGGELEGMYRSLESEYDRSADMANTVHKRVKSVEEVANDLFTEWDSEIDQISTPTLQAASRKQLNDTRIRYNTMIAALKKAELTMDPVLTKLHDNVLFLKHNLNAQAIASLKGEATNIQTEIARLINEMNASIAKADEFIRTLDQP